MLLKLNNITVYYSTAKSISNINISLDKRDIVSIIGANGAGKSTILKAISGLEPLHSGTVEFLRKRIDGLHINKIVGLGISQVPEGRRLFPYMSVLANVKLGAYLRKDKEDIDGDLEKVFALFPRLKERRRQKAGSLSGGEQQMVAIGRALMSDPKLLMMDEPSLGLAPVVINHLADAIKAIHGSGISILLVEQNAGLVMKTSTRCYVVEVGKVVLEGDMNELMADDSVRKAFLG